MLKFFKRIMIIMILKSVIRYIFARLREASTWRNMILLIGGTWALHNREQSEMIVQYLIAAAGFFGVFLPDSLGNYLGNKINSMDQPLPPIDLVGRSEPIRASSEPVRVAETQEQVPEYIQHVPSHGSISVLNMPVEETFTHTEADISTDSRDSAETGWGDK